MTSNISNTRKSVSSGYPNPEKWVEKTRRSRVFLTDFEVFGYMMKHSFEFLIWLLKPFINLGEIQSKSSQNFMLIKIRYPNHRHGDTTAKRLRMRSLVISNCPGTEFAGMVLKSSKTRTIHPRVFPFSKKKKLKTGHFTLLFCRGRKRNVPECVTHVQSHSLAH